MWDVMILVEYAIEKKGFIVKCEVCGVDCSFMRPLHSSPRHWEFFCGGCGNSGSADTKEERSYIKGSIFRFVSQMD